MIPKIIHFCWLSADPFPEMIRKCMDSWKKVLPDYEFVHWNFNRFPRGKSLWVDQAYDAGKYAFAADYIRVYALYNFGGIYLDTDVEVLRSFDELLKLPYFIGKESSSTGVEAAVIGCEPHNELMRLVLERYAGRSFVDAEGAFDTRTLPIIFREAIDKNFICRDVTKIADYIYDPSVICLFPKDWFSPKHWQTGAVNVTENTFSIHHFSCSWKSKRDRIVNIVVSHFGLTAGRLFSLLTRSPFYSLPRIWRYLSTGH